MGQLCIRINVTGTFNPTVILRILNVHQIAPRANHNAALDVNGKIHCWGSNEYGECGVLLPPKDKKPSRISLENERIFLPTLIGSVKDLQVVRGPNSAACGH